MPKFNFYFFRSKTSLVWSIRIKSRALRFRLDKIGRWWRPTFKTYKLEDLDLVGLYYEVGFVALKEDKG